MDALDALLEGMARLLEQQAEAPTPRAAGEGNFRCQRCEGCNDCRFCSDCVDCLECTYVEGCVACSNCTQSKWCRDCERISHSQLSRACDDSSYITLCVGCESCVHCFACVAMSGGEFCILNEKVSRKEYQARIAELRVVLERRLAAGWRPGWLGDDGEEPVAAPAIADAGDVLASPSSPVEPVAAVEDITVRRVAPERDAVVADATARPGAPSVTRGARPVRAGESPASRSSVVAARRPPRP